MLFETFFLGRLKAKVAIEGHNLACLGYNSCIYALISK